MRNIAQVLFLAIFQASFTSGALGQCRLDKSQWTLVFDEEFDEPSVPDMLSGKWFVGSIDGGAMVKYEDYRPKTQINYSCNSASEIRLERNLGLFTMHRTDGRTCDGKYTDVDNSKITSTWDDFPTINTGAYGPGFLYGMFECRCKIPTQNDVFPAFWLVNNTTNYELDAFEYRGPYDEFWTTNYWETGVAPDYRASCGTRYKPAGFHIGDEFHTWTIVWMPDKISFFLDGVELKTEEDPMHLPGKGDILGNLWNMIAYNKAQIVVNNSLNGPQGPWTNSYQAFEVDYVKVYKPSALIPYDPASWSDINDYFTGHLLPTYQSTEFKKAHWRSKILDTDVFYPIEVTGDLYGLQGGNKYMYRGAGDELWTTYGVVGGYESMPVNTSFPDVTGDICLSNNGDKTFYISNGDVYSVYSSVLAQETGLTQVNRNLIANEDGDEMYYVNNNSQPCFARKQLSGTWVTTALNMSVGNTNISVDPADFHRCYFIEETTGKVYQGSSTGSFSALCVNPLSPVASSNGDHTAVSISPTGDRIYFKDWQGYLRYVDVPFQPLFTTPSLFYVQDGGVNQPIWNVKHSFIVGGDPNNPQFYYVGHDNRPYVIYTDGTSLLTYYMNYNTRVKDPMRQIIQGQNPTEANLVFRGFDDKIRILKWDLSCENPSEPCGTGIGDTVTLRPSTGHPNIYESGLGKEYLVTTEGERIMVKPYEGVNNERSPYLVKNPVRNKIQVSMNGWAPPLQVVVQSLDGRSYKRAAQFSDKGVVNVEIEDLSPGTYTIRLLSHEYNISYIFVKVGS